MPAILFGLLSWAMAGFIQSILVGAGISFVAYVAFQPLIEGFLQDAVTNLSGLPSIAVQFLLLAGAGEALSIIGSAVLTRVVISAGSKIAGIKLSE